jgi:hypothetical protein
MRVTSEQVEDILQWVGPFDNRTTNTIAAICRDWLDMGDRLAAAERVIAAAQEAVVHGDIYRRALANELRRIAPDEPLQIDPGFAVRAGASAERFRMRLATLATLARDETAEE